jgi:hypothetical protein
VQDTQRRRARAPARANKGWRGREGSHHFIIGRCLDLHHVRIVRLVVVPLQHCEPRLPEAQPLPLVPCSARRPAGSVSRTGTSDMRGLALPLQHLRVGAPCLRTQCRKDAASAAQACTAHKRSRIAARIRAGVRRCAATSGPGACGVEAHHRGPSCPCVDRPLLRVGSAGVDPFRPIRAVHCRHQHLRRWRTRPRGETLRSRPGALPNDPPAPGSKRNPAHQRGDLCRSAGKIRLQKRGWRGAPPRNALAPGERRWSLQACRGGRGLLGGEGGAGGPGRDALGRESLLEEIHYISLSETARAARSIHVLNEPSSRASPTLILAHTGF